MSSVIKCVYLHDKPKLIYNASLYDATTTANAFEIVPPEEVENIINEIGSEIISKAQHQANQMIIDANFQSEKIKQQAQDIGFLQGYEEGKKQGRQEVQLFLEDAVLQAQTVLAAAKQEAEIIVQSSQQDIMKLAFAIAEKILAQEIEKNQEATLPIIIAALQEVRDQDKITVMVAPEDYEMILQSKRDLQIIIGGEKSLIITPDATLTRGSYFVETMNGKLDARIDTQLAILKKTLQDVLS